MKHCLFRNNFLHVDIFYQDMSYESTEQNVSFEFLSLLSEIGGFLGLLLGASVLTVCELLDYLVLVLIQKCKRNKSTVAGTVSVKSVAENH